MAKLNWGKASLRELDPARVQRTLDFSTPDDMVVKKGAKGKKPARSSIWATALSALSKAHKAQKAGKAPVVAKGRKAKRAVAQPKQKPVPKVKEVASPFTEQKRRAEAEARRATRTAHNLAKASKQQTEMEAKKKTNLQTWVEEQDGLTTDRESLRQRWRARLLGRPEQR
jgi:ABC-type uncharacterized transport system permease subunit